MISFRQQDSLNISHNRYGVQDVVRQSPITSGASSPGLGMLNVTNGDMHDHLGGDGAPINHTSLLSIGTNTHAQIDTAVNASSSHIAKTNNPHSVTLAQVGGTTNHTALTNIGTNTHAQIDTHIAAAPIVGTWTPVVADASTGGNLAGGTFYGWKTYDALTKQVTLWGRLEAITTAGMTAGNAIYIRNLPYTSKNATGYRTRGVIDADTVTFSGYLVLALQENVTYAAINQVISVTGDVALTVAAINSGNSYISFGITYLAE